VWKREAARFVGEVVARTRHLLASNGGPVIMLQVENEYTGEDKPYLEWAVTHATSLTQGCGSS